MEDDIGAKAPVTRLRRRLSIEQSEEVKSPSAPSTPSKKRGGRLAAKPQLELIDENSSENTPKRQTKKLATKDVIEASEEKVLTPSRRSTRIKSNTSIVSDTPQNFDSPRAKRAARRTSQIGSDNEAPLTPAKQTRRTRKDSTSSIDKQETASSAKKTTIVADPIIEEIENNSQKLIENEKSEEITPKRKSPRLQKQNKQGDIDNESEDIQQKINITPDTNKNKLSDDTFQLIKKLDDQPPKNKTQLNNSTSSVFSKKTRRNRTNTWTAAQNDNTDDKIPNRLEFETKADDNESNFSGKENNKDRSNSKLNDEIQEENKDLLNTSKSKKKRNSISSNNSKLDLLDKSSTEKLDESKTNDTIKESTALNETEKIFEKPPITAVQSLIYFDDSDSDSRGKPASDKPGDSEDQCVPVVPEINQKSVHDSILNQNENANDKVSYNDTCEPMDIDETMPTNVSLLNSSNSNQDKDIHEILEKSQELKKSVENIKSPNKSKRESTSSLSTSQNNDKTGNENKSTLILSQLKDVSTTDNSLTKSPKSTQLKDISTNNNTSVKSPKATVELLSKSVTNIENSRSTDKKDSLTYMTSTPLQQKNLKKMALQLNTSVISNSNNGSIQKSKKNNKSDSKQSNRSADISSTEESDSENVSTKDKSDFLDDEAEEASNDYESGDSQDEEEKQYAEENEILEKGETLDSDDDGTNDTDYEKDSFVVSSDEEDNELLSGSGDDLSMSDNELTMSRKSKNKFNERKSKAQKKASREMYEARHNISNNSSKAEITKQKKNKRLRLNSSTLQSEEEIEIKSKKNKKLRINSSQDSSIGDEEKANSKSMAKEHEITSVCNESITDKNDPLSIRVKPEPQTPLKDLDMSTVPILDNIEEVQVNENVTIMKSNETSDPLQDDSDAASSISENMEISSNYDSVLKELNKEVGYKKIKSLDTSLNLNKKTKQSANDPIVDTLNLTNTKKSKHVVHKNETPKRTNTSQKLNSSDLKTKGEFDDSSSDSIDLQLLFSEDSSDGIKIVSERKQDEHNETETYIPLKRTEAKTSIPEENAEDCFRKQNQSSLNTSVRKHIKKNSLSTSEDLHINTSISEVTSISLSDTNSKKKKNSISHDGDLNVSQKVDSESSNTTLNISSKSKKKNSLSINDNNATNNQLEEALNSTLNTSIKKKKKKNSISTGDETNDVKNSINEDPKIFLDEIDPNQSINASIKKKKKNSICVVDETCNAKDDSNEDQKIYQDEIDPNQSINTSIKKKKKKNSISVGDETRNIKDTSNENLNLSQNIKSPNRGLDTSSKKKIKKNSITINYELESAENIGNQDVSVVSQMDHNMSLNNTLNSSSKKKKKNSISVVENEEIDAKGNISVTNKVDDISFNKSSLDQSTNSAFGTSSKKKKNNSLCNEVDTESKAREVNTTQNASNVFDKSTNEETASAKKKKKHNDSVISNLNLSSASTNEKVNDSLNSSAKKNNKAVLQDVVKESQDGDSDAPEEIPYTSHKNISANTSDGVHIFVDTEGNQDWNTLITSGSSKKKNKKNKDIQETPSIIDEAVETDKEETGKSMKRKRKSSANSSYQEAVTEDHDQKPLNDSVHVENKRKKQKTSQPAGDDLSTDIKDTNNKQNKKRKERDDDDVIVNSKVFKHNSSDKLSVPRLPSKILNQLEDKPKKEILQKKKAKVVSTTQFIVEEAQKRKNKPSNYLEESVYLNDSVDEKKQKGFIKIPKVLPFVPTATISGSGFTTKFQINVLAKETKFVAQTSNMTGFKNEYLSGKKIKKAGTYEMYKSQRNRKMSKF